MIIEPIWQSLLSETERRSLSPGVPAAWPKRPDVLIVGGGLIGLSTAWFLSKLGAGGVLLVEQASLAGGASGANGGGIFAGSWRADFPPAFRELGFAGRELLAGWAEEEWADFDWMRNGSLAVAGHDFAPASREPVSERPVPSSESPVLRTMEDYVRQERQHGRGAELVAGPELRKIEPALDPAFTEGIYYPDDASLNPLRLAASLVRAMQKIDVALASGVRVQDLKSDGGRIVSVKTSEGDVAPGSVVFTGGWSAGRLLEKFGIHVPLGPAKGQLLATAPLDWRLTTNLLGTHLLRQLPTGEVIAGGTIEFVGESYEPTDAATDEIVRFAHKTLPVLRDVPFVRVWTGLRPHTPDEMPIIDRVPGLEGAFLAAGHFTKGVLLSAITGQLVAEWILTGRPSKNVDFLRLGRFADSKQNPASRDAKSS